MNTKLEKIQAIPTNIITGFLGVGKTTAILSLLANKPENERWAVLVNEFGEIGIDGSLLQGQYSENSGIFIREVLRWLYVLRSRVANANCPESITY